MLKGLSLLTGFTAIMVTRLMIVTWLRRSNARLLPI